MISEVVLQAVLVAVITNTALVLLALSRIYIKFTKRWSWIELSIVYLLKSHSKKGDEAATEILGMMNRSANPLYKKKSLIQHYLNHQLNRKGPNS